MLVKQRFPNFVEHDPTQIPVYPVDTIEELQAIDFVAHWATYEDFVELKYGSRHRPGEPEMLMAIMKEKWWVIAYGREGSFADLGLTEWVSPCS